MLSTNFISLVGSVSGELDPDAEAFLIAAGITDITQRFAINNLVIDLKFYGIWNKLLVAYPFVGGSASPHSYNLKNPATNQLSFSGGWTHASTGATPNGTNAFTNTGLAPSDHSPSDFHLAYYSRTDAAAGSVREMGSQIFGPVFCMMSLKDGSTEYSSFINGDGIIYPANNNTNSQGFYVSQRISATTVNGFKNGTQAHTSALSNLVGSGSTRQIFIGANNAFNGTVGFSSKQVAFSSIGSQLNATEQEDYYDSVQAYQTTLSRQV